MKTRPFNFLFLPLVMLSACSNSGSSVSSEEDFIRPEEYYADFSGPLEHMNINYANRRDGKCGVEFWWSKAKIITPDHYMVISTLDDYNKRLNGLTAPSGSVDFISFDGIYFDDGAMPEALRLGMVDYDYRQVFIYYSKPARVEYENYFAVFSNLITSVRKYASEAEVYFFVNSQKEIDALSANDFEKVYIEQVSQNEMNANIQGKINNCTNVVTSHPRETDNYASNKRESIEWSKIMFQNSSTFLNKNKRILDIGASVMNATYSFLLDEAPTFNIDGYFSSRGSNDVATQRELDFIFRQYEYDGIHFNSGSHIKGQTSTECYQSVSSLIDSFVHAESKAKLIFSNSTPRGTTSDLTKFSDAESLEIIRMSDELMRICAENDYPFDDLYNFAKDNGFVRIDAIHYKAGGEEYLQLGKELAKFFRAYIK